MTRKTLLPVLIWLCGLAALAAWAMAAGEKLMSVQVRQGELRAGPSFLAAVVRTVAYGDRLAVLEEQGPWARVSTQDRSAAGWIHTSALTRKRVVLQAGQKDADLAATSDEIALAGKGFNSDVEAEFKARNRSIDFTWVDRMEKMTVSPKEMQTFLAQGGVKPGKGGTP